MRKSQILLDKLLKQRCKRGVRDLFGDKRQNSRGKIRIAVAYLGFYKTTALEAANDGFGGAVSVKIFAGITTG